MTAVAAPARAATRVKRGHAGGDAVTMAWRNLLNIKRNPQLLVFATIQPVIFVVMFRYVFGGAIQGSLPAGQTYVNFLMPGIFVQTIVFGALTTGVGLADDLSKGLIDRFRSLPMARSAVLVGRTLADFVRNFFVVILMCIVGFIVGWTIGTNVWGLLGAIGIILAFSYALSWVFAIVGLTVKDAETAQAVSFPILAPLVFASSAFVPVRRCRRGCRDGRAISRCPSSWTRRGRSPSASDPPASTSSRRSSGSSASSRCARRSPSRVTAAPSEHSTSYAPRPWAAT
jgi:ABC-type multidrug transport system permease subunit